MFMAGRIDDALLKREQIRNVIEARDLRYRTNLMFGILGFAFFWVIAIIAVLILKWHNPTKFSDSIIIALLSSGTIHVFGLVFIMARYYFRAPKE
jgi:hypothetical protein